MLMSINRALAAKRDALKKGEDEGFTLIELLVVILIIGILTAIAIPVFLGQQEEAKKSAIKSDLANAKIALVAYKTASGSDYTTSPIDASALSAHGYTKSDNVSIYVVKNDTSGMCLVGGHSEITDKYFYMTESSGAKEADGAADSGSCPTATP